MRGVVLQMGEGGSGERRREMSTPLPCRYLIPFPSLLLQRLSVGGN